MDVSSVIHDIRQDIRLLTQDIVPLEEEYALLERELADLESSVVSSKTPPEIHRKTDRPPEDDFIPPLVHHEPFDGSIARFFRPKDGPLAKKHRPNPPSVLLRATATVEIKDNVLYENIFRFGGITAFPINKFLFSPDDEILGVRFDTFSHSQKTYLKPHYAILRKVLMKGFPESRWSIYRHTLPLYIPLTEYAKELLVGEVDSGVAVLAKNIREYLLKTQYKHDKLDALQKMKYSHFGVLLENPVFSIERDLECLRVTLSFADRTLLQKTSHKIELQCSPLAIESAKMVFSTPLKKTENLAILCENLLRDTSFVDLVKTFRRVIRHLLDESLF